ncbi:hypothetical protein C8R44DRAFT_872143 [Mycena epipterygia]|nr:hypothetical protein C8R44DRAFT_872143 [Mycena epipterygia]
MPRPPPLQLQFDNMFPGIARPRMQFSSLITAVYQGNWRMLVICLASVNALRYYLSASGAMDDLKVDLAQNNPELAGVSRMLATLYTLSCGIELFGAFSAFLQRHTLIRTYAYLAFLSAAIVTSAGVVTTAAYFTFADALVGECVALVTAGELASKTTFTSPSWAATALSSDDAQTRCLEAWSSDAGTQVVSVALYYLLPAAACALVAHVYYVQTKDPAVRASAIRLEEYAPLPADDAHHAESTTTRPAQVKRRTTVSPRSYHTAVAVAPVDSSLSPGPPSFSVAGIGDARAYQAFRLSAGSEDGAFI